MAGDGDASDGPESGDGERLLWAVVGDAAAVVATVVVVAGLLIAVSGVVPPLLAIESGSMEPHIDTGDMVFVTAPERFPGPDARHGVVTAASTTGYEQFGADGDVIVFAPNGDANRTLVIHRAMFYVESGENWYDRADPDAVGGADNCRELANCPAPHDGFVTKGDAVATYDQAEPTTSTVVRPEWIRARAVLRIPELDRLRV